MSNHLKFLSNAFPVTLIYIGVGGPARGILHEGMRVPLGRAAAQVKGKVDACGGL